MDSQVLQNQCPKIIFAVCLYHSIEPVFLFHIFRCSTLLLNAAACLLTGARMYEHITPVLGNLHWLPVDYRIHFEILLLTSFKWYGAQLFKQTFQHV